MSRIPRTGRWLSMPARRAGHGGHPAHPAASTSRAADSTSAGSCPVGPWSFRRIVDIPFQACVAALDDGQPARQHGKLPIGQSLLRGPIERDPGLGTCRIEVRLARGPLRPPLRMRLDIDRWSATATALELIPCRRVRPTAAYFRAGHRLLDALTRSLPQQSPAQRVGGTARQPPAQQGAPSAGVPGGAGCRICWVGPADPGPRNIGVILADPLAASTRREVGDRPGRLTLLIDRGAPPDLAPALAASVAWHTRERVALTNSADADAAHVLLRVASYDLVPGGAPVVELVGRAGTPRVPERRLAVRAWVDGPVRRGPDASGTVSIPPLSHTDRAELARGVLPPSTPAGAALGWVARDLAGLTVGLALGAGSYRGYAHIGILRGLARIGLEPDYLAGTSIGAAVAGLYAMGHSAEESTAFLDTLDSVFFRPTLSRRSLLSNVALAAKIREICLETRIEELPLPLAVVAADLETGREIVFRRGLLWLAVLGSSAIPGIHPAVGIGPYTAVDGGIVNPVPSSAATAMGADKVVAVRLGRPRPAAHDDAEARERLGRGPSAIETIRRSVDLMQATIRGQRSPGTIVIAPECEGVPGSGLRRFSIGRRYIEAGEAAVEAAVPRIAAALPWMRS